MSNNALFEKICFDPALLNPIRANESLAKPNNGNVSSKGPDETEIYLGFNRRWAIGCHFTKMAWNRPGRGRRIAWPPASQYVLMAAPPRRMAAPGGAERYREHCGLLRTGPDQEHGSAEPTRQPVVEVLLATYNGERYLGEQLQSIAAQRGAAVRILASDDGSTDATRAVLPALAAQWGRIPLQVIDGPRRGFAENFRHLVARASADADYYAFSDQDDIWLPDKFERAIAWLSAAGEGTAALYCGRTLTIGESGQAKGMSPLFAKPPSFRNAVIQSIAGGNTMLMNRRAFDLLRESCRRTGFVTHDWWSYMIVTGSGGQIRYDAEPLIRYRQHEQNLIGANNSWRARMYRMRFVMSGRFIAWADTNLKALDACADMLTAEAHEVIRLFRAARTGPLHARLGALFRSGIYRQTTRGQFALYVACIFKRL